MLAPAAGAAGEQLFTQDPVLGSLLTPNLRVDLGFEYLRPHYGNQATTLVIPPAAAGAFPVLGQMGDLSHEFAFVPRFGVEYQFQDLGFGLAASGKLFTLEGSLRRTVTGGGVTGVLNAEDSISIAVANFLEATTRFDLDRIGCLEGTRLGDCTVQGSLGARYSYVRQDFTASLTSNANLSSLTATQDFTGFGVTGSLGMLCPLGEGRVALYGFSRGSLLVGRNNRTSTFSVVVPSIPTASAAGQVTETGTELIPVNEVEVGLTWGLPLRRSPTPSAPGGLLWLKVGLVAQVWGNLGLLEQPVGNVDFSDDPLILYGFTILAGFDF